MKTLIFFLECCRIQILEVGQMTKDFGRQAGQNRKKIDLNQLELTANQKRRILIVQNVQFVWSIQLSMFKQIADMIFVYNVFSECGLLKIQITVIHNDHAWL